jgi:hypothetical protein
VEIALGASRRVHPLVCREDCPLMTAVVPLIERYLTQGVRADQEERAVFFRDRHQCATILPRDQNNEWQTWYLTPQYHAWAAIHNTWDPAGGVVNRSASVYAQRALGNAARVPAQVTGWEVALEFCLGLAKELGL